MATAQVAPRWGESLFSSLSFKVMLTTSSYVFDEDTHRFRSSVTNEVTGTGYTAGGMAASTTVSYDTATDIVTVGLTADVSWTSSAITNARRAIVYVDTGSSATDPIVGVITFDEDKASSAEGTFTLEAPASGLVTFQGS